jgi:hypothetical protein
MICRSCQKVARATANENRQRPKAGVINKKWHRDNGAEDVPRFIEIRQVSSLMPDTSGSCQRSTTPADAPDELPPDAPTTPGFIMRLHLGFMFDENKFLRNAPVMASASDYCRSD